MEIAEIVKGLKELVAKIESDAPAKVTTPWSATLGDVHVTNSVFGSVDLYFTFSNGEEEFVKAIHFDAPPKGLAEIEKAVQPILDQKNSEDPRMLTVQLAQGTKFGGK
jgi:hypothetical protein